MIKKKITYITIVAVLCMTAFFIGKNTEPTEEQREQIIKEIETEVQEKHIEF